MGEYDDLFAANPFSELVTRPKAGKGTGVSRLTSLAIKGATLGVAGAKEPAEGFVEHAAEFVGSIPTIAAVSAVVSPAVGLGLKAARMAPGLATLRMATAGATGAATGAVEGATSGEGALTGALKGAAGFGAAEGAFLGGGRLLRAFKGRKSMGSAGEQVVEAAAEDAVKTQQVRTANASVETATLRSPTTPTQIEMFKPGEPVQPSLPFGPAPRVADRVVKTNDELLDEIRAQVKPGAMTPEIEATLLRDFEQRRALELGTVPPALRERMAKTFDFSRDPDTGIPVWSPKKSTALVDSTGKPVWADEFGNIIETPPGEVVEKALQIATNHPRPDQLALPLGPEQLSFLGSREGEAIRRTVDVVGKREPVLTSNMAKMTEEMAQKVADETTGVAVNKLIAQDYTHDAIEIESLLKKFTEPTPMPEWLRGNMEKYYQTAERLGIVDKVIGMAEKKMTAKEISKAIPELATQIEKDNIVRSVRWKKGIAAADVDPHAGGPTVTKQEVIDFVAKAGELPPKERHATLLKFLQERCK